MKKESYIIGDKEIFVNKDYRVIQFTKEELEQLLIGKIVRFWTKDCSIMPDFDITAPVTQVGYFNNGEVNIVILRKRTGANLKVLSLSSNMANLKFRILSD
ncbi:MAG: hypothetical protein J1F35_03435 [Erysipelotrichales bacterium]|nr:hypothetical protein [Erysipelotrichales bacterium]